MNQLENPWLENLERDIEFMFLDMGPWDRRDKWELFAFAYEFNLVEDLVEYDLKEGEDPYEHFEAMPDKEAVKLIEHYIETVGMIADFVHWRKENQ